MATILQVLSSSDKVTVQDEVFGNHDERYLTLGNTNPASENRFYVSLSGQDAQRDWQAGDRIMVELGFLAYKHQGQWHISHPSDALKLIEISSMDNNKEVIAWEK
jgi:hypothetical protein